MLRTAPLPPEGTSTDWTFDGATGAGVRVAIIDSGVQSAHPDLGGCVAADLGAIVEFDDTGMLVVRPGPHDDAYGHGTAVAGIVHDLAPAATVVSVRVLGTGAPSPTASLLAGLGWAVEQRFEVINISLGVTERAVALELHELCDRAYFVGSLVVAAASNTGRISYPSMFASVASVACNLSDDPRRHHYNPDPPTEFLARGIDVDVAWARGQRTRVTGNSFAAAHLSGLAALVKSKHPDLAPLQLKSALWSTAANVRETPSLEAGRLSRLTHAVRAGSA